MLHGMGELGENLEVKKRRRVIVEDDEEEQEESRKYYKKEESTVLTDANSSHLYLHIIDLSLVTSHLVL